MEVNYAVRSADDLTLDALRIIVAREVEGAPEDRRPGIRAAAKDLKDRADFVQFLSSSGEGASLWKQFESRVLNPGDRTEVLVDQIDAAFPATELQEEPRVAHARSRLGLLFLGGGFALIALVYLAMPWLSKQFEAARKESLKAEFDPAIKRILDYWDKGSMTAVTNRLAELNSTLAKVDQQLNKLKDIDTSLTRLTDLSGKAGEFKTSLEAAVKSVGEVQAAAAAFADVKVAEDGVAAANQRTLSVVAIEIESKLKMAASPEALSNSLEALSRQMARFKKPIDDLPKRIAEAKTSHDDYKEIDSATAPYCYIDKATRDLVVQIAQQSAADSLSAQASVQTVRDALAQPGKVVLVEQATLSGLNAWVTAVNKVAPLEASVTVALGDLNKDIGSLAGSAKSISDQAKGIGEFLGLIREYSREARRHQDAYAASSGTMEDLRKAVDDIKSISEMQSQLAYRASSPAMWLLLAIGGMFVTMGASFLQRWLRIRESARERRHGEAQARTLARLAAVFSRNGVSSTALVESIPRASNEAKDDHGPRTPPIQILSEIGKLLSGSKS